MATSINWGCRGGGGGGGSGGGGGGEKVLTKKNHCANMRGRERSERWSCHNGTKQESRGATQFEIVRICYGTSLK